MPKFTDEACAVINTLAEGKWKLSKLRLLYLAYTAPYARCGWAKICREQRVEMYGECVMMMEAQTGRVLTALAKANLMQNIPLICTAVNSPFSLPADVARFGQAICRNPVVVVYFYGPRSQGSSRLATAGREVAAPLGQTEDQAKSALDRILRPEYSLSHEPDRSQNLGPIQMLSHIERMTVTQRQKWERTRAQGHAHYILRSFLFWGLPMWAAQTFGTFIYDAFTHKSYVTPFQIWSPAVDFIVDLALWLFGFGYVMGESIWQKQERDFHKEDHVA